MPQHAQPNPNTAQIITDAAAAIKAGTLTDDMVRMQAAGYAAQEAADSGNTGLLDLLILIGAGEFNAALKLLVDMSTQNGSQAPAARSPFAGLTNPTAAQPATAPASAPATTGPTRGRTRNR